MMIKQKQRRIRKRVPLQRVHIRNAIDKPGRFSGVTTLLFHSVHGLETTFQPFCYTDTSQQHTASPESHRQCVVLVRPANIELRLLSLTLPHSVLSSRTRNSSGVWRRVKASMVEETLPQCLNPSRNFGYKNKLCHP